MTQALAAATAFGPYASVLKHADLPAIDPSTLGDKDVLIRVLYSDVNPVDLQKVENNRSTQFPFVPGYGGCGRVVACSPKEELFQEGDMVCFLGDPRRSGSYATHIVVDARNVAKLPGKIADHGAELIAAREAASIPVAGLTALECLVKVGLLRLKRQQGTGDETQSCEVEATTSNKQRSLLVVGGSGGVGSWVLTLARGVYGGDSDDSSSSASLSIAATASSAESQEWCTHLGATTVLHPDEIESKLEGGREGSVDAIICLAEPTPSLFANLSNVVKPYGTICLVVAGKAIESLNLGFCFFKCANVVTETVFSSQRDNFQHILPSEELSAILSLMADKCIQAPLSPDLGALSERFEDALESNNGILKALYENARHRRGKLVMKLPPE